MKFLQSLYITVSSIFVSPIFLQYLGKAHIFDMRFNIDLNELRIPLRSKRSWQLKPVIKCSEQKLFLHYGNRHSPLT